MNQNPLKKLVIAQKEGKALGLYSCCSSNPFVIKAVLQRGKETNGCVLIESTANQVDQFGGYSGMTPEMFKKYVVNLAKEYEFDTNKLFLGGDHLGPLTFAKYDEEKAMSLAKDLIEAYVLAGYTKIHIDTSMKLASDDPNTRLSDQIIAERGAILVEVAEQAYKKLLESDPSAIQPVYIVGSEVPIPGGSTAAVDEGVVVTSVNDFLTTVKTFETTFSKESFKQVIAFVVQPGVEEKDSGCTEYVREKALDLSNAGKKLNALIFEGHSTDYQTKEKLRELVEDGFAILKVGPGLTFKVREGLYALSYIENEVAKVKGFKPSHFIEVLEETLLRDPKYWINHYHGNEKEIAFKRHFSFSDRSRYYMGDEKVQTAITTLFENLKDGCPLSLLSQFMPIQYTKVRNHELENNPEALVIDKVKETIDEYLFATKQDQLF